MSARSANRSARSPGGRRLAQVRAARRRRGLAVMAVVATGGVFALVVLPNLHHAVQQGPLPLKHSQIIREQARDKDLDPALLAGVIYAESRFRDGQVSAAGALGLMQLTPETARDVARRSGGFAFGINDLGTPKVNISYGAYHLRYLKRRFDGNTTLVLAAYNAGEGNVAGWLADAAAAQRGFTIDDIPFPETRAYVQKVLDARRDYRTQYAAELGL